MLATLPRRSPRVLTIGLVRRCRLDKRGDHEPSEEPFAAHLSDQRLFQAERLREANRILEFMRAGGGVLVHR